MSREREETGLRTADFVSAAEQSRAAQDSREVERHEAALAQDVREGRDEPPRDHVSMGREEMPEAMVHEGEEMPTQPAQGEPLAALFDPALAQDWRLRWSNVQIGFVDDPGRAVQQADELVAQVMKRLAETFARQRAEIEAGIGGADQASTEKQRLALRRYRSFFERLLSL